MVSDHQMLSIHMFFALTLSPKLFLMRLRRPRSTETQAFPICVACRSRRQARKILRETRPLALPVGDPPWDFVLSEASTAAILKELSDARGTSGV